MKVALLETYTTPVLFPHWALRTLPAKPSPSGQEMEHALLGIWPAQEETLNNSSIGVTSTKWLSWIPSNDPMSTRLTPLRWFSPLLLNRQPMITRHLSKAPNTERQKSNGKKKKKKNLGGNGTNARKIKHKKKILIFSKRKKYYLLNTTGCYLKKKKKPAESIKRPKKATWKIKMSVEMKNSIKGLENYSPTVKQT